MARGMILIADDDSAIRTVLNQALARAGYIPRATGTAASLWRWISQGEGDVVITKADAAGKSLLPARYDTATTLGCEIWSGGAKEGRPEPLRLLIRNATKWKEPLPPSVAAYCSQRAKKLLKARRGHTSLHPARVIAIARMVRDRLEFHQLHTPAASLNAAAKHIGDLIGQGQGTPKAAHRSVYRT